MPVGRDIHLQQRWIIAEFAGCSQLLLPREATFKDLAGRLAQLFRSHPGSAGSVKVTIVA